MAENIKVLGQQTPLAGVMTTIYTATNAAVVSTISCCNQNTFDVKIRISIAVAGAVDDPKQYIYYDVPLEGNNSFALTAGITLANSDVIRGYSDRGNVSFNVFGTEVS